MGNLYYSNSFGDPNYLKFSSHLEKLIDNSGKKKPAKTAGSGAGGQCHGGLDRDD